MEEDPSRVKEIMENNIQVIKKSDKKKNESVI